MMDFSSFIAVYFSIMNLEQSFKDLQAQNTEFQALILNLSKGQEEMKAILTKKKKKKGKKTQVKKLRPILQLRDAETSKDSDEDEQGDDASIKTSNQDSAKPSEEEEDYHHEDEHPDDKYKLLEERMKAVEIQKIPGLDFEELGLVPGVIIPPKFKTPACCIILNKKQYF